MVNKKESRLKRAKRARCHLKDLGVPVLSVFRSSKHIRAQLIHCQTGRVLASASTLEAGARNQEPKFNKTAAAEEVGRRIAERILAQKIEKVGFDRSGFKYHGRVRALADGARSAGLKV